MTKKKIVNETDKSVFDRIVDLKAEIERLTKLICEIGGNNVSLQLALECYKTCMTPSIWNELMEPAKLIDELVGRKAETPAPKEDEKL